jgi:streptogramin lyase
MFSSEKRFMSRVVLGFCLLALATLFNASAVTAQERYLPDYPRVTLSTCYEVDPAWPERPKGAEWGAVSGIAVDRKDQVWLFTRANPPVQVYDARGRFVRAWGENIIQTAHGIEIDREGMVWVTDIANHVVMKFTPEGKLLEMLGTFGRHGNDATHFNEPTDVAITRTGDVYVSDGYGNSRVAHFDASGKFVRAWGKLGTRPGEFSLPHAIAVDSKGRVYVADRNNVRVQVFDSKGKLLDVWDNLLVPWGIWISPKDEIWVCGSSPMPWRKEDGTLGCPPKDQLVMKFDPSGKVLQLWTFPKGEDGKEKPGDLNWLHAIGLDSRGNLYLGDIVGQRAQKFLRK